MVHARVLRTAHSVLLTQPRYLINNARKADTPFAFTRVISILLEETFACFDYFTKNFGPVFLWSEKKGLKMKEGT